MKCSSLYGGTVDQVMHDNPSVDITDVAFTEDPKYGDDEDGFLVDGGELDGQLIYTHHGPIHVAGPETFEPVMKAAQERLDGIHQGAAVAGSPDKRQARYRCKVCQELVAAEDRADHLIAHAPAYGAAEDPQATAGMFEAVEPDEGGDEEESA